MTRNRETTGVAAEGPPATTVGFDRRALLRRGAALGAGLAGAGALARLGVATAQEAATPGAASPAASSATPEIVAAAHAFLGTLSDAERETVLFDWTDTAQKQRWSNLPEGIVERAGLRWGDLGEAQHDAWLNVMRAALSPEGYERVVAIWYADDAWAAAVAANPGLAGPPGGATPPGGVPPVNFGTDYFYVAVIGAPSETEPWQWQFGGHHLAVNATVVGDNLALTPSFVGVEPATYADASGETVRPLGDIADEAFALVGSLDAEQQAAAVLGDEPIDVVLGPGQDGRTIQAEGLPAAEMDGEQRAAFLRLIGRYAGLGYDAEARLAEIEEGLDEAYLAWYGPTEEGSAAYFRVTGPTVVIEYAPQIGGDATNHVHGIYRDPTNDYGARSTGITIES